MPESTPGSSALPNGLWLLGTVLAAVLAAVFFFGRSAPAPAPVPLPIGKGGGAGGGPAVGGGRPGGGPAPAGGAKAVTVFIPDAENTEISPMLKSTAVWPARETLRALREAGRQPAPGQAHNFRLLIESLLARDLRPNLLEEAYGYDDGGKLFVRVGRAAGKTRCEGLASCEMVKAEGPKAREMITFAVSLTFPDAAGPVSLTALTDRVRAVVAPGLAEELSKPDYAPQPSPLLDTPEGIAAVAMLDRQGYGMIHPYLYLHAGPKTLVMVFQQVPDNKPAPLEPH
ncbi:MAG: hypothetical protein HYZ53_09780 [Planctomycetes bacterium]|nr:hypothetical protein [Planctomycetota bacterium]